MIQATFIQMTIENKSKQYVKEDKKGKSDILSQLVADTGRSRKSLIRSLNGIINKEPGVPGRTGRPRKYNDRVKDILGHVWEANDYICAERMHGQIVDSLKDLQELSMLDYFTKEEIDIASKISLGSLKRVLGRIKKPLRRESLSNRGTRSLQKQIPIRTKFKPNISFGYFGIDFVDHTGGNSSGTYARSFDMVDPKTTWICRSSCLGKSKGAVEIAFDLAIKKVPYKLKGLHSDNEPALLDNLLQAKARSEKMFISRTRSYKKEDNGHVEQKNGDKIRLLVGYRRYDTIKEVDLLNRIYEIDDVYQNHFIASYRLTAKEYDDLGKLKFKKYSEAKTAYQRILEDKHIPVSSKNKLIKTHKSLNRVKLKLERDTLLRKL